MSKFQFSSIILGCGLILIGAIMSMAAAVTIISDPPPPSIFDQTDDVLAPDQGTAPEILPTSTSLSVGPKAQGRVSPTETAPTHPDFATVSPPLTATPQPTWIPDRLVIPAIQLDTSVLPSALRMIQYSGKIYPQWKVPDFFAAGWAPTSATLGVPGNTVFFGHHNTDGEVFAHLVDLQVNDLIVVYSGEKVFTYSIAAKMILPERNQPIAVRLQNAAWILPSSDERITLLTCWPYLSNTHRLVIVAVPVSADHLNDVVTPRLTPLPTRIPE